MGIGELAAQAVGLFLAPFVHENIAIVSAAILVTSHQLPRWLALASLYGGMTTSDLALYGIGALARRNSRARRLFMGRGNHRLSSLMCRNMELAVVGARLVPGMIFPSYVACGWMGMPFRRFFVLCLASAAIYLPAALALALAFGEATTQYLGYWAWAGLILPLTAAGYVGSRVFSRKQADAVAPAIDAVGIDEAPELENEAPEPEKLPPALCNPAAVPRLPESRRLYSWFEFWPGFVFYAPLYLYIVLQALRHRSLTVSALANPAMENGGLWGESKQQLFDRMGEHSRRWLAPFFGFVRGEARDAAGDARRILTKCQQAGIDLPFIVKPDVSCQGNGVRIISDIDQLHRYLDAFPVGERIIVQRFVDLPGEAGVFYVRYPGEPRGRISSLTLKSPPWVLGDGVSTVEDLIRAHPRARRIARLYLKRLGREAGRVPAEGEKVRLVFVGNHCKGSVFRDGRSLVTPALVRRIDDIARDIPDFYFGRIDLRFASLSDLLAAEGFTMFEYNGGASEATHIWDADMSLLKAYRDLFAQVRAMFAIGAENRRRGHRAERWDRIVVALWQQSRLMKRYPTNL